MSVSAAIFGCGGTRLAAEERAFFRSAAPLGFILFARNVESPEQVRGLTDELRDCVGRADAPVLIDQEGGRVARLRPPHWRAAPAAARLGALALHDRAAGIEAARLNGRLLAAELHALGITVDCVPVLDLRIPGAHAVIGDRAFGADPDLVAALGRATAQGLLAGGVLPVIKHIPGHGRAEADSHLALPVVKASRAELEASDFRPFRALADMPWAMAAHVLYSAIDPDRPASISSVVVTEIIRGSIGFDGVLICDDLSMAALTGDLGTRARAVFGAGCDIVLHCNGNLDEMRAVAAETPALAGESAGRVARAAARLRPPDAADTVELGRRLEALLNATSALHA